MKDKSFCGSIKIPQKGADNYELQCREAIMQNRIKVYEAAKAAHPERWNGRATKDWSLPEKVYLNPEQKVEITEINSGEEATIAS